MKRKKLTSYQRIVRAAHIGVGVLLSSEEVAFLAADTTIRDLAENDDIDDATVEEGTNPNE